MILLLLLIVEIIFLCFEVPYPRNSTCEYVAYTDTVELKFHLRDFRLKLLYFLMSGNLLGILLWFWIKKTTNYALAQANIDRIYYTYRKGHFWSCVILSNMKLCNAVSCPAHEVKLNLTSLSWENVCVMYLNNNG